MAFLLFLLLGVIFYSFFSLYGVVLLPFLWLSFSWRFEWDDWPGLALFIYSGISKVGGLVAFSSLEFVYLGEVLSKSSSFYFVWIGKLIFNVLSSLSGWFCPNVVFLAFINLTVLVNSDTSLSKKKSFWSYSRMIESIYSNFLHQSTTFLASYLYLS